MTTTYNLSVNKNPNFNTVLGLANKTFDIQNVRSGYMATEDQIQQLWQDIIDLEQRIDYCCRDIVFWDFRIRIRDKNGNIISDYLENRTTGIARRGKNFTMKLPIKAIPKYEQQGTNSVNASYFVDGSNLNCVRDETIYTYINNLCSLLYRGSEGQYYDLSARKTTGTLGFASGGTEPSSAGSHSITAHSVNESGTIGSIHLFRTGGSTSSASSRYLNQYSHYAYVDDNNDIYVDVLKPIGNSEPFNNATQNYVKPYGRVYQMDVRDVTLG